MLSLIWGLYDEMYGIRPWKGYEARFEKLYSRYLASAKLGETANERQIKASARVSPAGCGHAGGREGRYAGSFGDR